MKPQIRLLLAANAVLDAWERVDPHSGDADELASAMDDLAQVVADVTAEVMA